MAHLYIDYTGSVSMKNKKFHGGSYYTKKLITSLLERKAKGDTSFQLTVLWPNGYEPTDEYEKRIIESQYAGIERIEDLKEISGLGEETCLMIPLISITRWSIFQTIKNNNPRTKLYLTIHGIRIDDMKFDWYDRFYSSSNFKTIVDGCGTFAKKVYLRHLAKKYLPYVDKIFTVSNFTMQAVLRLCNVSFIKPYYEGIFIPQNRPETSSERFILFVSANRAEKNFVRGLEAFLEYKKINNDDVMLYVTGTNDELKNKIYAFHQESKELLDKYVRFCGYVDNSALEQYYWNCLFLLYTSKSEGFGLPVLEMALRGKTAVVSSATAIPEVLGASVYYVDPYKVESIQCGISYMMNSANRKAYENSVEELRTGIQNKIENNLEMLLFDILN